MYRIAIADDHELFRKGIAELISGHDNYVVRFEAEDGLDLMQKLENYPVDIVLLDIRMPNLDGIEVLKRMNSLRYPPAVIILSMFDDDQFVIRAFRDGVSGYLSKNIAPKLLYKCLETVVSGDVFLLPEQIELVKAANSLKRLRLPPFEGKSITKRELQVLTLLCDGFTNEEVGERLFLSKRTVENHRKNLLKKTGTKNTAQLVAWAFRKDLIV